MTQQTILVLGATGKTGSRIVTRLEDRGHAVRRGSRNSKTPFDWEKPQTWPAILDGVSAAYISYFPDIAFPGAVEQVAAFSALAREKGLQRLVLLTGRGEFHAERAEWVVRNSGVPFTIVRAAWFAQNYSEGALLEPVMAGVLPMPAGDVREPIIDVDDIADVAVAALTEEGHTGELYEVTGPRLMTFAEMAAELSRAMGRTVQYVPISFEDFHAEIINASGEMIADVITDIARETLDGRNANTADGVQRALGRAPRDFSDFADEAAKSGAWTQAA
ncbi:NmrA family NAD(P)-binding protein [Ruegeria sp. SCSIO 43209]|uniref:SDR family oxidoreductase n=1 Tax=Ruegeria sp. SCSIO 43209 TaxID=2793010 RepID=UPI001CA8FF24|nr:NmrA family NAD(P)-binding protein [Ruegeria sp. SCSIO 43209]UAB89822.1 NmrA family NAD(P)-binding protein [Ruegeria sp. SCSIO 43209]